MIIDGLEFTFVSLIKPGRDESGKVLEYSPAGRYHNRKALPLNKWGSGPFCYFRLESPRSWEHLGVYAIVDRNGKVLYVGKCTGRTSTLAKRFNSGYGIISPKNCYSDGQSTNCRVNHLVLEATLAGDALSLVFHQTRTGKEASSVEASLISDIGKPPWNINEPW